MPSSPVVAKQFDLVPVPPPRTRKKASTDSPSLRETNSSNESCNESGVGSESVNINCDQSVQFKRDEHNVRPQELNLQLNRKDSKERKTNDLVKVSSTPSADSDNQSVHSTVGSDMSSPVTENSDSNDKLSQSKQRVANSDRAQESFRKSSLKTKFKVHDLRPEELDESLVSRIISKCFRLVRSLLLFLASLTTFANSGLSLTHR